MKDAPSARPTPRSFGLVIPVSQVMTPKVSTCDSISSVMRSPVWSNRMGQETELKLIVPPANLTKVTQSKVISRKQTAAQRAMDVTSVYYDTKRHDLLKRGITVRLSQKGDEHLQTVKADINAYPSKKEWESRIADNKPDFAALKGTALEPLLDKTLPRRLKPVFETRVRRT